MPRRTRVATKWVSIAVAVALVAALGYFVYAKNRDDRIAAGECKAVAVLMDKVAEPIGQGAPITVVGDSYSQGWGLDDPRQSWVSTLGRKVTVRAASGAGYTKGGLCGALSIPGLAEDIKGPVIVEAGLNDVDGADLAGQAKRTISELSGTVILVGPTLAPSLDPAKIKAVDATLAKVAADAGVKYISAINWKLNYKDGLHLTPESHLAFGRLVAAQL